MDILAVLMILMAAVIIICMMLAMGEIELIKTKIAGFGQFGVIRSPIVIKPATPLRGDKAQGLNTDEIIYYQEEEGTWEGRYGNMTDEFSTPPIMPTCKPPKPECLIFGTNELIFGWLKPGKIYYLCHPATTGGRTIEENKRREELLYQRIIAQNPEAKIIRPLALIPDGMEQQEAMDRCYSFIDASHAIILPLGWQKSTGCSLESKYAKYTDKEQIFIKVI